MTCLMHGLVDAYNVLLQAQNTELQRVTAQLAEKQCVVEVKQAEIGKLGDCLTSSQQEVAAEKQEKDSAVHAYSLVAQVCIVVACRLADALHLHMSI